MDGLDAIGEIFPSREAGRSGNEEVGKEGEEEPMGAAPRVSMAAAVQAAA